jgi:hypothetical protein
VKGLKSLCITDESWLRYHGFDILHISQKTDSIRVIVRFLAICVMYLLCCPFLIHIREFSRHSISLFGALDKRVQYKLPLSSADLVASGTPGRLTHSSRIGVGDDGTANSPDQQFRPIKFNPVQVLFSTLFIEISNPLWIRQSAEL